MQNLKKAELYGSWLAFAAAATVYILTVEPTAGFWDCGEFITAAYKLQVGHPPGAPLYMLLGRIFSLFAGSPEKVALTINIMSALASAFTIMFLFLTITHLARKIAIPANNCTTTDIITVIGAGFTGALAYTFTDSFWFSAVEAEVYALSSLFTAVVFWAILKWEDSAGQPGSGRWLILIAYLMGLSTGVHLLNLLAIPAIVFIYYFKNYPATVTGFLKASAISVLLLAAVMYGVIQGFVVAASYFELFFVNTVGLPFKSGVIIYLLMIITALIAALIHTRRRNKPVLHTIFLGITVMLIGYSSYTTIVIRSHAGTPMDQNSPDNMFSLLSYLNREQYGDRPLLYGPFYNAPITGEYQKRPAYIQKEGRYMPVSRHPGYRFDNRFKTPFPRMYSHDPNHIEAYREWGRIEGREVEFTRENGRAETIIRPTFAENLRFFATYQLGHMYFRYFMWNFAGRQNDIQGHGRLLEGNWMSGIHFIDHQRLGPQYTMPDHLEKNRARNRYYLLPLMLGIIGLLYHIQKNKKDAWVVFLLFFFTGIAIVIYLNQTPYQPRERDYAYVGSFYAFAIWIGIGVLAVYENLRHYVRGMKGALLATLVPLIFIPGTMAVQNWNDHDRSGRYTARDMAVNYLNSCAPNAILFTYGDNDTFPLWYAQEVEGIRTDVRVVNLSYLATDWYIDQMKKQVYESAPLPVSMERSKYIQGTRELIYLFDQVPVPLNLHEALDFLLSDDRINKLQVSETEFVNYLPSKTLTLPVDTLQVLTTGTVEPNRAHLIDPEMEWYISRNYLGKSDLALLDIIATNNWERPLYFAVTVPGSELLGLHNYLQLEGMAYRLVPILKQEMSRFTGHVNTAAMYSNVTGKFRWGNIYDPAVYLDETHRRMGSNLRNILARLAGSLVEEGRHDSAAVILDLAVDKLPHETIPYNYFIIPIIENYYLIGEGHKASALAHRKADLLRKELNYYFSMERRFRPYIEHELNGAMALFNELLTTVAGHDRELEHQLNNQFSSYYQMLMER
ncbi:MAG: DUF2723 domain-containing protein [Marinilabiliales bacterium]|nr:MAG: DUF2723 domain-containing protein [Marinilabiliales bacterium]